MERTPAEVTARLRTFFDRAAERECLVLEELAEELGRAVGKHKRQIYRWRSGDSELQRTAIPLLEKALERLEKKYGLA